MKKENKELPSLHGSVVSFVIFSETLRYNLGELLPDKDWKLEGLAEISSALFLLQESIKTSSLSWCFPFDALNDLYCEGFVVFPSGKLVYWPSWMAHQRHKNEKLTDFIIGFLAFLFAKNGEGEVEDYVPPFLKMRKAILPIVNEALTIPLSGRLLDLKKHYQEAIENDPSIKEMVDDVFYLLSYVRESEEPITVSSLVSYLAIKEKVLS